MARIIQFPVRGRKQSGPADPPPVGRGANPWRELWENPITQAVYSLSIILIACAWPVLKWFVGLDLFIQVLRMVFVGGLSGIAALMHFLVVGFAAYLFLYVPPLPPR